MANLSHHSGALKITERMIEETCTAFLELDGWRCIKTDLPHLRGLGVQEPGMCDRLYLRYWTGCIDQTAHMPPYESWGQILFIEWKSKRGKNPQHQKDWREKERARGALVWAAKEDFGPSIEAFQEFYRKSGLMRKDIK